MRIAVVHDYFNQSGGAERVAEEMYCMVPGAELVTTVALADKMPQRLADVPVTTSWMQKLPRMHDLYRYYFFLYPFAVESLDMSGFDLVLSSSSGYAKGVKARPDAIHVCYCHVPMRWVEDYQGYVAREGFSLPLKLSLPLFIKGLKKWDLAASKRPDYFVTNSRFSAERILAAYGRRSEIIPPPINVERFSISEELDDYYLILARLVPYRRIDTAVTACTKLNRPLCVIGAGPDLARLQSIAGPSVRFLGKLSDQEVNHYISRCRALLFPGIEDFGMTPLEAAAAGRPTIAIRAGGAMETIIEGSTGLFFEKQSAEDLADAIQRFERESWDPLTLRQHAMGFSVERFRERFFSLLDHIGVPLDALSGDHSVRPHNRTPMYRSASSQMPHSEEIAQQF